MYTEFPHNINPIGYPADDFDEWAMSMDAWLDTPPGMAWLAAQCEAFEMASAAERYGSRPGLEVRHAHR